MRLFRRILSKSDLIFKWAQDFYESSTSRNLTSSVLVFCFVIASTLSVLQITKMIDLPYFGEYFANPFFSIEIVFTLLLIVELFGLIFVLPRSVAQSVGKQFELLSLIFLRDGFKEFSHMGTHFDWEHIQIALLPMVIYSFGALALFSITSMTSRLQRHIKITATEDDQVQFIQLKKLLALVLLIAFAVVGFNDIRVLITTGNYLHSFQTFYTVLIFADIIIVLIALRYTLNYYRIFRYSAFVLATILIRISLSAETYYNVMIGVVAAIFVLALTASYNYFLRDIPEQELE